MTEDGEPENYLPIGEALPGIEIMELPKDCIPLAVMVYIKYMAPDGHEIWGSRYTKDLSRIEATGAATVFAKLNLDEAVELYDPQSDD